MHAKRIICYSTLLDVYQLQILASRNAAMI
jgi:hypothetical protein